MRRLVIVTDVDGCLLDADTYAYEAARPALAELAQSRTPLVLCSAKTRAELQELTRALAIRHPFIVENGGAIVFPPGSFYGDLPGSRTANGHRVLALARPRSEVVAALRELARECGARLKGFADMSPAELASLTGLSEPEAARALEREHDEGFVVEDAAAADALLRAAEARGLQPSHGGRFHHVMQGSDKGVATRRLLALYEAAGDSLRSAGLGDAPSDLPLLQAVERPILVPRPDGSLDPDLAARLPAAERAPAPGPAGWNAAVLAVLAERPLDRVGA